MRRSSTPRRRVRSRAASSSVGATASRRAMGVSPVARIRGRLAPRSTARTSCRSRRTTRAGPSRSRSPSRPPMTPPRARWLPPRSADRVAGGLRQDLDVVEVPVLAMEREALVAPRGEHDLDGFAESGAVSSRGTPNASNSPRSNPRPAPQFTRPPVSTSSSATSSANRSG